MYKLNAEYKAMVNGKGIWTYYNALCFIPLLKEKKSDSNIIVWGTCHGLLSN